MNAITPYVFRDGDREYPHRLLMEGNSVWFLAMDVCATLGLSNTAKAIAPLDGDEKKILTEGDSITICYTNARGSRPMLVSEGGALTLILRSQKAMTPGTVQHRYRKWVTGEVLPALHRGETVSLRPQPPEQPALPPPRSDENLPRALRHVLRLARLVLTSDGRLHADAVADIAALVAMTAADVREYLNFFAKDGWLPAGVYPPPRIRTGRPASPPDTPLRLRREATGMTQIELAERVGYSNQQISNIESGRTAMSVKQAHMLAEALGCRIEDIMPAGLPGPGTTTH